MANLLAAEFHRIRRDPVSWLLAAAALISGLVYIFLTLLILQVLIHIYNI